MRKIYTILAVATLTALPSAAGQSPNQVVCAVAAVRQLVGVYPEHPLSPQQSLISFDTVFLGEVVVPSCKCSLGYCAGIRVMQTVKGRPGTTALVRVDPDGVAAKASCIPSLYATKGERWLVFANQGNSKSGLKYFDSGSDGPSFAANKVPDFSMMEAQYRGMRAQIEQAIGDRLR
jgi:hypothetical protein